MNKDMNTKIVIYSRRVRTTPGFGHIGIAHHFNDGLLYTIEGNKAVTVGDYLMQKIRMSKLLGYATVP